MSIKVENISKLYGTQKALDEVSFEIKSGEIIGFLGPNGAGKSTMMKILTCYIPQTSGKAEVCGFDVKEQSLEVRRQVGYLPEHNPLYLDMYVKEYLEFIGGLHHISNRPARVKEMIGIVGLQVEQNKKIGALSKGYRQRVGLAQALIHDPKVLILDEPTSGLDPNQLEEIRNLIKETGKEKTVMLSTHIMQEVEAVCDRVIIINKGKIVANDGTHTLQQSGEEKIILRVEFDKEVSKNSLKKIEGVEEVELIEGNTWHIITAADKDIRKAIFNYAVACGASVLAMQKEEQKLEDVFKKLTK
ncbi:MAG TPA: gliding motility-associated ABC transporter ATP-binding subunit GldA [Bacteroidia bacterium]|jgi:ABC-2 type transport system ATP-binding protein|nr:gliding motility-associated ABC transporter ATP-binding subunit GldA [Bacteroidia bacterium]